ncbi:GtrA family protein [Nocardioides fonticola]
MGERWRRVIAEAGRFLAVGGVATIVAFVLFNGLAHGFRPGQGEEALLADRPILAYVIANSIGMIVSYHGARYWAFRDRPTDHADGGRTAFVVVNIVTMGLPILCLWISRNVLGLDDPVSDNIAANVVGLALGVASRFWIFRTFVFRRPIHLAELYAVEELAESPGIPGVHEPAARETREVTAPTDPSTGDPAPRSAP